MKMRIMLSWIAVSIAALPVFAAPYCGVEELPDLIKCLPAPPEPGSADFARDVARYEWGKEQRTVAALILAEVNPAKADEIFVRAMQYGENRVIAGAHWQSDVDMIRSNLTLMVNER